MGNKKSIARQGILLAIIQLAALFVFSVGTVSAIARGYTTQDADLQNGMVVALSTEGSSQVERASLTNSDRVVGVVTTFDKSAVTVASGTATVLVESEGEVDAYVSDMSGDIKQGDLLVLSPLKGILMKGTATGGSVVVGIAATSSADSTDTSSYTYTEANATKSTKISKVRVNLNRQGATAAAASQSDSNLSELGRAIVGKDVGEIRVLVALLIFIVVLIAEGGIIYGAVSSAITALGRNPLARKIIRQEMVRVILVALVVMAIGLGAIYVVLWI